MTRDCEAGPRRTGWNLRWNIIAGYVSQTYSTIIGIIMVPLYLRYMGTEAYGLIGFFAILQLCIQALDMGVTPTLSREAARSLSGATSPSVLRKLLRSFEWIFVAMGIVIVAGVAAGAQVVATRWLNGSSLSPGIIGTSIVLMAGIAWLRWFAGLYRGVIVGLDKQVWQSGVNITIATLHSVAVIPYLRFVGATPVDFFSYQMGISVIELGVFAVKTYQLIPGAGEAAGFDLKAIRSVFRFSMAIAFTTGLWVAVSQFDKVVLSRLLPLAQFGIYSIATVVAGGVTTLSMPLRIALMPRLTELSARSDHRRMLKVYRNATQFTSVLAFSSALFLALFAEKVLWVWTGNAVVTGGAASTMALYALGNGVAAFGAFPYYLQYAKGEVRLHVIGTLLFLLVLVPTVMVLALRYGAVGAGSAWLLVNLAFLLLWVPYVHRRFLGRFHFDWIRTDILSIALATTLAGLALRMMLVWPRSRGASALVLLAVAAVLVGCAGLASPFARESFRSGVTRIRQIWQGAGA